MPCEPISIRLSWCSFTNEWRKKIECPIEIRWQSVNIFFPYLSIFFSLLFTFTLWQITNQDMNRISNSPIRFTRSVQERNWTANFFFFPSYCAVRKKTMSFMFNWQSLTETWECVLKSPITDTHVRIYAPDQKADVTLLFLAVFSTLIDHRVVLMIQYFEGSQQNAFFEHFQILVELVSDHCCCHARQVSFWYMICTDVKVYCSQSNTHQTFVCYSLS